MVEIFSKNLTKSGFIERVESLLLGKADVVQTVGMVNLWTCQIKQCDIKALFASVNLVSTVERSGGNRR